MTRADVAIVIFAAIVATQLVLVFMMLEPIVRRGRRNTGG